MAWIDDLYSRITDFRQVVGTKLNYLHSTKEDVSNKKTDLLSANPAHYPNVPAVRDGIDIAITTAINNLNQNLANTYIPLTEKGISGGVVPLNSQGLIDTQYLPGFLDDVIDLVDIVSSNPTSGMTVGQIWYNTTNNNLFTATSATTGTTSQPESGVIYVNTSNNSTWRWSGSTLIQLGGGLVLGITSTTAFRGDHGKIAYDHTFITGNPHNTQINDIPNLQNNLDGKANIRLDNLPSNLNASEQQSIRTKLGVGTGNGTIQSVGLSMPVQFSVTNSPLSGTGGTITVTVASGYIIPTTTKSGQWDIAYTHSQTTGNPHNTQIGDIPNLTQELAGKSPTNHTHAAATSTALGFVKLGSDTIQTAAAVAVTNTASRTYSIQVDSNGRMVVNVPWVVNSYFAGTVQDLENGTGTVAAIWSPSVISQWTNATFLTLIEFGDPNQAIPDWAGQLASSLNF